MSSANGRRPRFGAIVATKIVGFIDHDWPLSVRDIELARSIDEQLTDGAAAYRRGRFRDSTDLRVAFCRLDP